MNGQSAQPLNKPIINKLLLILSIATLLLGFFLGIFTSPLLPKKVPVPVVTVPSPSPKSAIDESKLPVSLALLTNPIVYEWRGSVKGKITQKDDHTFTLVDEQGSSITISDKMPSGDKFKAMFFDKSSINKQISLKDIPLGSVLLGDFFIFKGGPNTPVGSSFIKQ